MRVTYLENTTGSSNKYYVVFTDATGNIYGLYGAIGSSPSKARPGGHDSQVRAKKKKGYIEVDENSASSNWVKNNVAQQLDNLGYNTVPKPKVKLRAGFLRGNVKQTETVFNGSTLGG